jgi:hypothetical protein
VEKLSVDAMTATTVTPMYGAAYQTETMQIPLYRAAQFNNPCWLEWMAMPPP